MLTHPRNERIAKMLRAMADRIEKSPHEYTTNAASYGGRVLPTSPSLLDMDAPVQFGPICHTLIIGDGDFVASHQVVNTMGHILD